MMMNIVQFNVKYSEEFCNYHFFIIIQNFETETKPDLTLYN